MQRVAALGYNIVMHVHDEMIVDVPIEDTDALERINACMGEAIPWAPVYHYGATATRPHST